MLNLTNGAYARLTEILAKRPDDIAARIVRRGKRFKLRRGTQRRGDEVFVHEGRTVLLLDENVCADLQDRTLDVRDTQDGPRLRLGRHKQEARS